MLFFAYQINCSKIQKIEQFLFEVKNLSLKEIILLYYDIFSIKENSDFRKNFYKKNQRNVSIPNFNLEDVEDYYTYYVLILNISENLFWNESFSFLLSVSTNKSAYESFLTYTKNKSLERR